jgi:glutamate-1-semialdehyde 2,1-aminomutase
MEASVPRNLDLETALAEARRDYVAANPKSLARFEAAQRHLPGANTRTVLHYPPFPLAVARAEGARLWDFDGHGYADFLCEYSAGLYGHSDPTIRAAIETALDGGIVLGGPNAYEGPFAELLCSRFPSLEQVRFCNSGTEANSFALATARAVTGRGKVLAFDGAYHGGLFSFVHGRSPINAPFDVVLAPYNDAAATRALIERHAGELAAVIVEPMMGGGGCIPAERDFLVALREATAAQGVLLIFDEVITSRLSPGGLQAVHGVTPDLTALGKYLGGGASFGAFGGRRDIMVRFDPASEDALPHAGTFNNNAITMAAGLAGLSEVYTPAAAEALNARGEAFRARLHEAIANHGLPLQVTGVGSVMCVHFMTGAIRAPADLEAEDPRLPALFHLDMLRLGQYLTPRGMVVLSLPMGAAELNGFVAAFETFLAERGPLLAA